MNDTDQGLFAHVAGAPMRLRTAAIVATIAVALTGCGGGGTDNAASPTTVANKAVASPATPASDKSAARLVAPRHAHFQGKTYKQWVVSFWQWVNRSIEASIDWPRLLSDGLSCPSFLYCSLHSIHQQLKPSPLHALQKKAVKGFRCPQ
ncbi:hypothetical protein SAMN05446935_2532 [Burkholderia sp. YR290]|uniref:hypothetical protein n=1 Tax=Paraburkholderia hospita TaxID=169430 RepID=UPI0009D2F00C|nr:hypothetical protein [Paraburkholderia hospita]SKC64541.1 hypothetical protein SAMN05446934_1333 [Paraburkholderia hospita]SOE64809.1 hypothetical protein SAMN05446935_2532 [Burkholderia sp. YR290]